MKLPSPKEMRLLEALGAREISGRDLAKRYQEENGESISYGTLYTTMSRLKDAGWVEARDDEAADRRVRLFKISGVGANALPQLRQMQEQFTMKGVTA